MVSEAAQSFAEATPDYERLLDSVARILTERLRDTCGVFLLSDNGDALRTVSMHADPPSAVDKLRQMFATEPILLTGHPSLRRTVETGEATLVPRLDASVPRGPAGATQAAARAASTAGKTIRAPAEPNRE